MGIEYMRVELRQQESLLDVEGEKPRDSGCKALILNEPCRARTCDPLIKRQVDVLREFRCKVARWIQKGSVGGI